jgi:hypothetical protein
MYGDPYYDLPAGPAGEDALPSAEELFAPAGDPDAALRAIRGDLGLPGGRTPRPRHGPDISTLAEDLGLR